MKIENNGGVMAASAASRQGNHFFLSAQTLAHQQHGIESQHQNSERVAIIAA
jgi:hypothetical protein